MYSVINSHKIPEFIMHTIKSIAKQFNLDRKKVENTVYKLRKEGQELGELTQDGNLQVRVFTDEERKIIVEALNLEPQGSQLAKVEIVPVDLPGFNTLSQLQVTGNVTQVNPLNVDLKTIETTVLDLVEQGKRAINTTRAENAQLLNDTLKTEKLLSEQLQQLQALQQKAQMEQYVTQVVVGQSQTNIKDLMGKLQQAL